jgi:glycosyltransferase involved in cell wall biosynthesis
MMSDPCFSLIVPLYNEEQGLPKFWHALHAVLARITENYEVILIDDGSSDKTWNLIQDIAGRCSVVKGVRFTRNFGKEAAIHAGLEMAKGKGIVVMDGDGQHPVELLPIIVQCWQNEGALVVAARKRNRAYDNPVQQLRSRFFNATMKATTGLDMEGSTDYRLLDRKVVDLLLKCPEKIRFFRGMTMWFGFATKEILFDVPPRLSGESQWGFASLLNLALSAIVAYSARPLNYVFVAGVFGVFVSFLLGLQAIYSWTNGIAINGWTSTTILILFFGSMNLVAIGIVGLYLAQLFSEIKRRPSYLIAEETS